MLKHRVITATILLPLLIWGLYVLSPFNVALAAGAITLAAAWEWTQLIPLNKWWQQAIFVAVVLAGLYFSSLLPIMVIINIGFVIWLWAFVVVFRYNMNLSILGFEYPVVLTAAGFLILISFWLSIVLLIAIPIIGNKLLLCCLLIVWGADTGAYFAGRAWGKKPLASRVSPNKTWAGFWGGLALGSAVAVVSSYLLYLPFYHRFYIWGVSIVAILFSMGGDLMISVLKRQAEVKDSGSILPGHGGILDRLDSIAAAFVVFALGAYLLLR